MPHVTSADGTAIAYDRHGEGPPVILVDGAFGHRSFGPNRELVPLLAKHFTVVTYDRRGRGESGDQQPYAIEHEVEDIAALVQEIGGSASVYGISSGAALALEAAAAGLPLAKLALFEAPFVIDDSRPPIPSDFASRLRELIESDRRADAIRYFMKTGVGVPGVFVFMMRFMPAWSQLKAVAHTVPYDALVLGDRGSGKPFQKEQWTAITLPTLVVDGGKSPRWMRNAMKGLSEALSNARYHTLEGQTHIVKAEVLAPALVDFFSETSAASSGTREISSER